MMEDKNKEAAMDREQLQRPPRSSPRILLVSSLFAPAVGGVSTVARELATNLGTHIIVVASEAAGDDPPVSDWPDYDRHFPFPVHRVQAFETELSRSIPSRFRGILQFAYNVFWTRRRAISSLHRFLAHNELGESIDVVCINTLGSYWIARPLQNRYPHMKVIFYLHGEEVGGGPDARRIDKLRNRSLQAADAVVVVSSFTRDRALRCGVDPGRLHIIHNGVDTTRFTPGPRDPEIEKRFNLAGKKVLLCLARLDERKGQDMLLRALPQIVKAVPDAILLIVGTGEDETRLCALAHTFGLNDHAIFAGAASDDEVVSFYRTADIFVMPNRELDSGDTEGFGLVFLEAGACAKPVIGGRAGGVPDAIIDGTTGYLVDGRSPAAIADACIRLLTHSELCLNLGQNGLRHSSENTWRGQSARFLQLCEDLCRSVNHKRREPR